MNVRSLCDLHSKCLEIFFSAPNSLYMSPHRAISRFEMKHRFMCLMCQGHEASVVL